MTSQKVRVAEDEQGRRASFDDIEIGEILGEMNWTVTDEMIDQQCEMDVDFHPWYFLESPWEGRVPPPQISYRPPRWLLSRKHNVRGLFYKWEMENLGPVKPNVQMHITAKIIDKYVKNEREFVVYEAEAKNPDGSLVFRSRRTHVLDVIERTAPRSGRGVDSGIKAER